MLNGGARRAFPIFFGPSPRVRGRREEDKATACSRCVGGAIPSGEALPIPFYGSAKDRGMVGRKWRRSWTLAMELAAEPPWQEESPELTAEPEGGSREPEI